MMKWSGSKNRYELPGDPGRLVRAFWWVEDHWLAIPEETRAAILLAAVGILLAIGLIIIFAPSR